MTPLVLAVLFAQPKAEPLPADWHGTWAGTLVVSGAKSLEVPMTLSIKPLDGGRVTWTVVRGEGDKKQELPYELVPVPGKPGQFEIDEKNGIRLSCRLSGDRLYELFKVGDQYIHAQHHRDGDVIRYELTSHSAKEPLATKPTGRGDIDVTAFEPLSTQYAVLKRQK